MLEPLSQLFQFQFQLGHIRIMRPILVKVLVHDLDGSLITDIPDLFLDQAGHVLDECGIVNELVQRGVQSLGQAGSVPDLPLQFVLGQAIVPHPGLFDVAKYCVKDIHAAHFSCDYFINQKVWDSLPKDLQEIISVATSLNANESTVWNYWECQGFYKEFENKGGKLITWPEEDFNTMKQYSLELMSEMAAKDKTSAKMLDITKKLWDTR